MAEAPTEELRGSRALVLDHPPGRWRVESGRVLIFRAAVEDGLPTGRRHLVAVCEPGEVLFGDVSGQAGPRRFLGVAEEQARLTPVTSDEVTPGPWFRRLLGAALGDPSLVRPGRESAEPSPEPRDLAADERLDIPSSHHWLRIESGSVRIVGLAELTVGAGTPPVPLPGGAWLVASEPSRVALSPAVPADEERAGIAAFNGLLLAAIEQRQADRPDIEAERWRAQLRHEADETDRAVRYLRGEAAIQAPPPPGEFSEYVAAVQVVARQIGAAVTPPSHDALRQLSGDPLELIARVCGLRFRHLRLPSDWWRHETGSFIGQVQDGEHTRPVGVLHTRKDGYEVFDPRTGERRPLSGDVLEKLTPDGMAVYRTFPRRALWLLDLPFFALKGQWRNVAALGLLMLVFTALGAFIPMVVRHIIDQAIPDANQHFLLQLALGFAAVHFGQATFSLTQGLLTQRIQSVASIGLQAAIWDRLLRLPLSFFRQFAGGDLLNRCEVLEEACHALSGTVFRAFLTGLLSLLYLVVLFSYSPALTLVAAGIAAVTAVMTGTLGYLVSQRTLEEAKIDGQVFGFVVQLINGVGKLRAAGAERRAFSRWTWRFSDYLKLSWQIRFLDDLGGIINFLTPAMSSLILYYLAGPLARPEGGGAGLTTGSFIAFLTAFGMVLGGITQLSETVLDLIVVFGRGKLLAPLLQTELEDAGTRAAPGPLTGRISVDRVRFRYRAGSAPVLDDVSFDVRPGEFLAVVGPSGSGKSTLMRLLTGLERPEAGSISYDGKDLGQIDPQLLRRQLGVVLQTMYVFQASIYENVVCGNRISEERVLEAMQQAGLADDVAGWPMGVHTVVSEGGRNLSGGQRQKLLIARALVTNPRVLVLDEATSALDNVSQAGIVEALARREVTRVVVAHRLSTIENADRVVVLDQGRVVQTGTFAELAEQEGLFRRMIERQQA